jgi:hypothetical protein
MEKCSIFGSGRFGLECSEECFFGSEDLNGAGRVFRQSGEASGLGDQFGPDLDIVIWIIFKIKPSY